jgi:hypothetical protein
MAWNTVAHGTDTETLDMNKGAVPLLTIVKVASIDDVVKTAALMACWTMAISVPA